MKEPLTRKQRNIYDFVEEYIKRRGYAPTYKEIGEEFNVAAPTIWQHIDELKKKGWIKGEKRARWLIIL